MHTASFVKECERNLLNTKYSSQLYYFHVNKIFSYQTRQIERKKNIKQILRFVFFLHTYEAISWFKFMCWEMGNGEAVYNFPGVEIWTHYFFPSFIHFFNCTKGQEDNDEIETVSRTETNTIIIPSALQASALTVCSHKASRTRYFLWMASSWPPETLWWNIDEWGLIFDQAMSFSVYIKQRCWTVFLASVHYSDSEWC